MLYLNRAAFNGLYRVNQRGEFNVPFGCKPETRAAERDAIFRCSSQLQRALIIPTDFRILLSAVTCHDTVFLDPPYTVRHDNNGFRRYNERIFHWEDQITLAEMASRLARLGAKIIVTSAAHDEVVALYPKKLFRRYTACRRTSMAANAAARGVCREAILLSESVAADAKGRQGRTELIESLAQVG
jgi:DNA adenine methylase